MILIEPPAPPPGAENNAVLKASQFLQKHEMWLIRLQAIKDSYPEPAYEKAEHLKGTREFLEASKLILQLLGYIAMIQAERLAELLGQVRVPEVESDEQETAKG